MKKPIDFPTYKKLHDQAEVHGTDLIDRLSAVDDIKQCAFQPIDLKQDLHKTIYEVQKAVHRIKQGE